MSNCSWVGAKVPIKQAFQRNSETCEKRRLSFPTYCDSIHRPLFLGSRSRSVDNPRRSPKWPHGENGENSSNQIFRAGDPGTPWERIGPICQLIRERFA